MIELELKYKVEELPELACSFEKKETVHLRRWEFCCNSF